MISYVYWSSPKLSFILVGLLQDLNFPCEFSENTQIWIFVKMISVVAYSLTDRLASQN